jgi:hypothetical protein
MSKRIERLLLESAEPARSLKERSIPIPEYKGRPWGKGPESRAVESPKQALPAWQTQSKILAHGGVPPSDLNDTSAPAVIKYRELAERKLRSSVPKRIPQLLRQYFHFDPMPFHVEILELMFKGGKIVINLPTDHAKSMLSSYWFPILSLMNNPDESHIICGANIMDSKRRVDVVRSALSPGGFVGDGKSNEDLLRDYPWIAKPNSRHIQWSALEISVAGRASNKPNPSLRAVSAGAADIRGRRGKLIMDDLEGNKHRSSPAERLKLYDFVKLEAIRCYEDAHESQRPLLCALGTPFDPDSIYFRLESQDWQVRRWPYRVPEGKYLWPAKKTKIDEFRKTMTKQEFAIAMEMDPSGGDSSILSYQQIAELAASGEAPVEMDSAVCMACSGSGRVMDWEHGRLMWVRCQKCKGQARSVKPTTLVVLDPATGSRQRKADYAGLAVIRVMWVIGDNLPRVEIMEAYRFTQGIYEQVKAACALARKYQCEVVYEANGQQGNNYAEVRRNLLDSGDVPDVPWNRFYTTQLNKNWDTKLDPTMMRTLLKERRLMVPESLQDDEGIHSFFTEIRDLGANTHDHILMAVWMGIRWTYENKRLDKLGDMRINPFAPNFARDILQGGRIEPTRRFGWQR